MTVVVDVLKEKVDMEYEMCKIEVGPPHKERSDMRKILSTATQYKEISIGGTILSEVHDGVLLPKQGIDSSQITKETLDSVTHRILAGIQDASHIVAFTGTDTVGDVSDHLFQCFQRLPQELQDKTCIVLTSAMSPRHQDVARSAARTIQKPGVHTVVADHNGEAAVWDMASYSVRKNGESLNLPFVATPRYLAVNETEPSVPEHLAVLRDCVMVVPTVHQASDDIVSVINKAIFHALEYQKQIVLVGYGYFNFPLTDGIKQSIKTAVGCGVDVKVATRTSAYKKLDAAITPYGPLAEIQQLGVRVLDVDQSSIKDAAQHPMIRHRAIEVCTVKV